MAKKKLVLEVLNTKWCKLIRIKEQSHRGYEFGRNGNKFTYNDFTLVSLDTFGGKLTKDKLFVLPEQESPDEHKKVIPVYDNEQLRKIVECVKFYNRYFSGDIEGEDPEVEVIE